MYCGKVNEFLQKFWFEIIWFQFCIKNLFDAHLLEFICGDFWNVDFADVLWEFWCFVRMDVCNFFAENFCMQLFSSYLPEMHKGSDMHFSERIHHFQDASLSFGRPGAGAPVRTKSGRLRSTVVGNPEIRSSSSLSSLGQSRPTAGKA